MDPRSARKIAKVIAIIVALAMIVTSFSFVMLIPGLFGQEGAVAYAASSDEHLDQRLANLKEYIEHIRKNYKDDVAYDQLLDGAFAGVMNALGDPYSIYYGSSQEGQDFVEAVAGEFSGVGLSIEDYNGLCRVVAPVPGTPADQSGIRSGDIVKKIDGIDIADKSLNEAVSMMRGEEGTPVALEIDRNGQTLNFTLTRELIKNVSVHSEMLDHNIGYIQISGFDSDSHVEFRLARTALVNKGAKALVLDLRNNPGGLINTALDIANQMMAEGPITHFEQQGEIVETYSAQGDSGLGVPIALLINEGSASASEMLAGALQDSKTATLVGTVTYGKGVIQQVGEFTDGSGMKLSVYYFLTPDKKRIDHVGITPDYTVQGGGNADETELAEQYAAFAPMSEKVKPKAGDVGLNVFGAQQRLAMLGYPVKATGTMDAATTAAVTKFQSETNLYPCGILDYTTMSALDSAAVYFIAGIKAGEDPQLEKALEVLSGVF
jgi:carboxyl-terminal processing protease